MKQRVLLLLKISVSIGIIWWLTTKIDWNNMRTLFQRVQWHYIVIAAIIAVMGQSISAFRWTLLARSLGLELLYKRAWRHYFVGLFFTIFLPGIVGGDAVRAWMLHKDIGGRTLIKSGYSVIAERVNGIYGMTLVASIVGWHFLAHIPDSWYYGMLSLCLALYVAFPLVPLLLRWLVNHRSQWIRKFFPEDLLVLWSRKGHWWEALLLSIVYQFLLATMAFLVTLSLGITTFNPFYFLYMIPTLGLISSLPISIGGHGVREGLFVLFLGWFGLQTEESLAIGLLFLLSSLATSVLGGIVFLLTNTTSISIDKIVDEQAREQRESMNQQTLL